MDQFFLPLLLPSAHDFETGLVLVNLQGLGVDELDWKLVVLVVVVGVPVLGENRKKQHLIVEVVGLVGGKLVALGGGHHEGECKGRELREEFCSLD